MLSPSERHRLALEARARDDEREWDRLVATCPMARTRDGSPRLFEVTEPALTERRDASHALALAVTLAIRPQLARLEAIPDLFGGPAAGGRPLRRRPGGGNRRASPAHGPGEVGSWFDQRPAGRPLRRRPRAGKPRPAARAAAEHPPWPHGGEQPRRPPRAVSRHHLRRWQRLGALGSHSETRHPGHPLPWRTSERHVWPSRATEGGTGPANWRGGTGRPSRRMGADQVASL
jgi:hypothetical protein